MRWYSEQIYQEWDLLWKFSIIDHIVSLPLCVGGDIRTISSVLLSGLTTVEMSDASVVCQLCNAQVSVRAGNLTKLQLHLERSHDVFQDQDILLAISFLDQHEKEVIIDQVIPRIKRLLDNSKTLDCSEVINTDLLLHEKLETWQKESETVSLVEASANDTDVSQEQLEEEQEDNLENIPSIEITKMEHNSDVKEKVTNYKKRNEVSKCYICNLPVKKYKLIKHRRNCQILQKQTHLQRVKQTESKEKPLSLEEKENVKEKFYCDLCPKNYDSRAGLYKHKRKFHT